MIALDIYCDGSGTHQLGPACIGVVVMLDAEPIVEVSEYVGDGTNNVAELRAIRRALYLAHAIGGPAVDAVIYSDSEYAIGSLTKEWTPRANDKLVIAMRAQFARMPSARLVHVDGHAGILGNEIADWLAGCARRRHLATLGIARPEKRRPTEESARKKYERRMQKEAAGG